LRGIAIRPPTEGRREPSWNKKSNASGKKRPAGGNRERDGVQDYRIGGEEVRVAGNVNQKAKRTLAQPANSRLRLGVFRDVVKEPVGDLGGVLGAMEVGCGDFVVKSGLHAFL